MRELKGKVAVVSGAASGIGRAVSLELAREGCDLAICDVDAAGLEQTANEVRALGRRVSSHRVDVADREQMARYADQVVAEFGRVEILVNNAGVTVTADFEQHSLEDWEWILGVNLWGVIHGCKFFLPHLKQAGQAHIVNVSSVFGLIGVPGQSSYCATKFAVRGLSEALFAELKSHGIGVTCVHPAGVRTNIVRSARTADAAAKAQAIDFIDNNSITPERCAQQIVRAIRSDRIRLLDSPAAFAIDTIKRMIPVGSQRVIEYGYRRARRKGGSPATGRT
jgi:NAD(P)-dependent dehydrogenase (short-subunit alcohol dehydrogenase family)